MDPDGTDSLWQRMGRALGRTLFGTTRSNVARIGHARGDEGLDAGEMAEGGVKPLDAHPAQSARVLVQGEHQVAQTVIDNAVGGIGGLGGGVETDEEIAVAASRMRFAPGRWFSHYQKHMAEFPEVSSSVGYLRRAQNIVAGRAAGFVSHNARNGDTLFYNSTTNEFAVRSGNTIRTLFKPKDGFAYWQRQLRR